MGKVRKLWVAVCVAVVAGIGAAASNANAPSLREQADAKAKALVAGLTLSEKAEQLLNTAPAIPRLNIPAYNWWTESLHGALGPVPTTNFPEPIGLAAAFDEALVRDVAGAISVEVRALHALGRATGRLGRIGTGLNTWSPNINIFRDPRWGRGQETYGEDPFLTSRLGVAYVHGMQGPDPERPHVIASPKHFAVHSGPESTRHAANVFVTPHDLEDTFLPAFRAAIVEGRAGSIMCAYNRVNGEPACVSDLLLRRRLRDAWRFDGYVVSDCDAVRDVSAHHKFAPDEVAAAAAALKAGVDNECNTATLFDVGGLSDRYQQAYARGLISMNDIDQALVRLFSARFRNGDLPGLVGRPALDPAPASVATPAHEALALKSAEKSLVLLKNDGVLPLHETARIVLVGPHADATRVLRGNYSSPLSSPPVSLLDGLRSALPKATVTLVPWSASITDGDPLPTSVLRTPDDKPGLLAQYYDAAAALPKRYATHAEYSQHALGLKFNSTPTVTRIEPGITVRGQEFARLSDYYRVVWTGFLVPQESGTYRIGLGGPNAELMLDGKVLAQHRNEPWGTRSEMTTLELEKGRRYSLRVTTDALLLAGVEVLWKRISTAPDAALRSAADAADVIVVAVGLNADLEGEEMKVELEGFAGGDKTSIDLPAEQRRLLEQVRATGKPWIVVLMNGSTLDLYWAKEHAPAIIEAWYPGQAGGRAIGHVIAGKVNPAGRLPLTFYRSVADLPPFESYSMQGRTYRYFDGAVVYPFGHGLSYSSFAYGPVTIEPVDGAVENGLRITATVRNTSDRAGEEVAQLYIDPPEFDGAPRLALRGFQRFELQPGEQRAVRFDLSPRDLSFVTRDGLRQIFIGEHRVSVGSGQPGTGVPVQSSTFTTRREVEMPL